MAAGSGTLNLVSGSGYGTAAPGITEDPTSRGLLNMGNEAAWGAFMNPGSAQSLTAAAYRNAAGGRQLQLGERADNAYLLGQNRNSALWNSLFPVLQQYAGMLPEAGKLALDWMRGGSGGGGFDVNALLAPMIRNQAEQERTAMNQFSSSGREIGGNTAFQNLVLNPLRSRANADLAAEAVKASLASSGADASRFQATLNALQQMQGQLAPLFQMLQTTAR